MPIYEFECQACGEELEAHLKMGASLKKCPSCGEKKLKKKFSRTIFHDTYSPMHPRRGRGVGGYGRIDPGEGIQGM